MSRKTKPVPKKHARPRHYIREWRVFRQLTQQQVADRVDMTVSSVSQIESGKQGFTDSTLAAMAHALQCDPADLFRDPRENDYQLWRIIVGMKDDAKAQALRVIKALSGEAA